MCQQNRMFHKRNTVGSLINSLNLGTNSWRVFSSKRFANFDFSSNFEHSFTLQTWLRLASNFAKTRFRRSPTFHFSTSKNFFETSNGRLPPKHGSDRRETLPKRVSGDPRHFIFRHPQTFLATNLFDRKIYNKIFRVEK